MESVMKILRVQTSPRGENSESRKLGDHLIAKAKRIDPTSTTILRDISTGVALPDLTWIGASFADADKRDAGRYITKDRGGSGIDPLGLRDEMVAEFATFRVFSARTGLYSQDLHDTLHMRVAG